MSGIRQTVFGVLVALVLCLAARDITLDGRMLASALALGCVVFLASSTDTTA